MPAQRGSVVVGRALSRVFHMLDTPETAMRKPAVLFRILKTWMTPRSVKKARDLYTPKAGPERAEMFAKLKTLLRKAGERTVEATWQRIGALLDCFSPPECANYLRNSGYEPI